MRVAGYILITNYFYFRYNKIQKLTRSNFVWLIGIIIFCFWFIENTSEISWFVFTIVVRAQRHDHAAAAAIRTNFHLLRSLNRDSFVQSSSDVPARRYETIEVLRCTTRVRTVFQPFSSHVRRVSRYEKSVKKCVKSVISVGNQCAQTNRENPVKYPLRVYTSESARLCRNRNGDNWVHGIAFAFPVTHFVMSLSVWAVSYRYEIVD